MQNDFNIYSFRSSDGNMVKLEYRQSLPSTMALAQKYAQMGYPDRYTVFAEKQTAFSALGAPLTDGESEQGIFLSCILRPSLFPSQASFIGPLSALTLTLALEEHTTKKIGIGWKSNIFCEGVKIGCVEIDEKNFPPRLTDMVRQVFEEDCVSIPMIMAKTVLNKFFSIYTELKSPAKHLNSYANKFALTDKKITYLENGKKKSAKVIGINKDDLTLNIETRDGRKINVSSISSVTIPNKI